MRTLTRDSRPSRSRAKPSRTSSLASRCVRRRRVFRRSRRCRVPRRSVGARLAPREGRCARDDSIADSSERTSVGSYSTGEIGDRNVRERDALRRAAVGVAATLLASLRSRALDQNAPHRLGRRTEEVPATVPRGAPSLESKVRLMDQLGRAHRLSGTLVTHLGMRQLAQLRIESLQETCIDSRGRGLLWRRLPIGRVVHGETLARPRPLRACGRTLLAIGL